MLAQVVAGVFQVALVRLGDGAMQTRAVPRFVWSPARDQFGFEQKSRGNPRATPGAPDVRVLDRPRCRRYHRGRGKRAEFAGDLRKRRHRATGAGVQGGMHGAKMFGHGAAATADDAHTRITGENGVFGHQFRCAIVMDMAVVVFRNPGLPLAISGRAGWAEAKPSIVRIRSEAPTPQLCQRPAADWQGPRPFLPFRPRSCPSWCDRRCQTHGAADDGIPARRAASAAALYSSGAEMVSTQSTSAPPSFRPSACSWNISTAAEWVRVPMGSRSCR